MTIHRLSVVAALSLSLLTAVAPSAQVPTMPVEEIRAGMVGTGRTVFRGRQLEDFTVHILGVLENVIAPNRDLILARLEGGPLARTGVIAGMSGSPVYVEGRLIGAVSYSPGSSPPSRLPALPDCRDDRCHGDERAAQGRARRAVVAGAPEELIALWTRDLGLARPVGAAGGVAVAPAVQAPDCRAAVASGFAPGVVEPLSAAFAAGGFVPMTGQAAGSGSAPAVPRPIARPAPSPPATPSGSRS